MFRLFMRVENHVKNVVGFSEKISSNTNVNERTEISKKIKSTFLKFLLL